MDVTPSNFHISGGSIHINGENIGSLNQDGATVNYAPDVHLHLSAKYGSSPVAATVIGIEATMELNIGETTLDNVLKTFGGIIDDSGTPRMGGVVGTQMTGVELTLTPFDGTFSWILHNAVPISNVEVAYSPASERAFVVTFRGMIDVSTDSIGYLS